MARRGAEPGGNGSEDVVVGVSIGAVGRHENHLVGGATAHGRRLPDRVPDGGPDLFPVPGEVTVGQAQALPRHVPGPVPGSGKAFQGVAELLQPDRGELFRRRRWRAGVGSFPRRAQQHADRGADGVQPGQQPASPERFVVRVRGQDNEGPAGERRVIQRQVRQPGGGAAGPGGLGRPGVVVCESHHGLLSASARAPSCASSRIAWCWRMYRARSAIRFP